VVVRGSGRTKLDDEIVELEERDVARVPPGTWRSYEARRKALSSSCTARPISARSRATTSRASAPGGLMSTGSDLLQLARAHRRHPQAWHSRPVRPTAVDQLDHFGVSLSIVQGRRAAVGP
jgi:hypothetical protein